MKLNKTSFVGLLAKIILLSFLFSETAHSQLIFAARHVIGRINQMSQEDSNNNTASQFATVIIDAPANKVYATAVNVASQNTAVTIVSQDSRNMKMNVTEGGNKASISVVPLGNASSEIMISATVTAQNPNLGTSAAVNSIMKICNQLNKVCKPGAN
jgi:hypothetical protein